jgi:predicted dinucleotide-binding enzyme
MTTVGLIGSGNIGGTVARLAVAAGYDVVLSNSRGPETLQELVDDLGPRARAATPAEAAAAGDLVVVSIPMKAYRNVPVEPLAGKVVIDTNNYYPQRDGQIPELDDESTTTSELLQRHLPTSRVVKGFNNIYFKHLLSLARPAGAADRSALAIAGDDADAKARVTAFLDALGYDSVDAGSLAEGWRFQRDTAAYANLYFGQSPDAGEAGVPADTDTVRSALAAARR